MVFVSVLYINPLYTAEHATYPDVDLARRISLVPVERQRLAFDDAGRTVDGGGSDQADGRGQSQNGADDAVLAHDEKTVKERQKAKAEARLGGERRGENRKRDGREQIAEPQTRPEMGFVSRGKEKGKQKVEQKRSGYAVGRDTSCAPILGRPHLARIGDRMTYDV